ncbi:sigma-70 family RNA polymerase sigma factor [Peptoniphilus catoniae]|uniref:sigma-70 family RNA polymerase sigma factor n=1 Tax=Peptoniphilus catoniae TaxID=1660341 RepID=UPI0010FE21F4|nr:sigma-70 family RNA polymerase sigma factor [Peptoniphilus catoniae]
MDYKDFNSLLDRCLNGDNEARLDLLNALTPLIASSIKSYCPIWQEYEDLFQDGVLLVLECLEIYNPSKGRFLNFVKNYLRFYFLDTFKYLIVGEYFEDIDGKEDFANFLRDTANVEEEVLSRMDSDDLKRALGLLTKRQRDVIVMYYFLDMRLDRIGEALDIKRWTVVNTKRRAIEILRGFLC